MTELLSFNVLTLLTLENLIVILVGTLFGMAVGVMPGLGPTVGVALLVPMTFGMDLLPAILLLVAVYQGACYGGSISAIVLGIPGTASASATVLDGNSLAKKGFPGQALGYSLYSSVIGGLIGGVALLAFMAPLTRMAFRFSDPEIFLIAMFGLVTIVTLGSNNVCKNIIALLVGLLMRSVGTDLLSGVSRFTLGIRSLHEGFVFVAVITGLFAFSEVLSMSGGELGKPTVSDNKNLRVKIPMKEFWPLMPTMIKSSLVGVFMGIIPGLGPSAASWVSYNEAKRTHSGKKFGEGEPLGIVSCEASNNACVGGALLPLLSMGIPGSGTIAVLAAAFLMQGIQPGPQIINTQPDLLYGILWGFLIAVFALLIVGQFFTALTARLLVIPNYILLSIIMLAIIIGSYGVRNNMFDVGVAALFGITGFIFAKLDYPFASFLMGFVLGNLIETSFRRSLTLFRGDYLGFFGRPISVVLIIMTALLIANSIYVAVKARRKAARENNV